MLLMHAGKPSGKENKVNKFTSENHKVHYALYET